MNIPDMSDNIKRYGGFIPGLRPGKPTTDYLDKIMTRITLAGAIFLAFIAIMPNLIVWVTGVSGIYFGGTALLIVVGVALDTMKQIESLILMRHYQGFMILLPFVIKAVKSFHLKEQLLWHNGKLQIKNLCLLLQEMDFYTGWYAILSVH